jgi:hypothetical protein
MLQIRKVGRVTLQKKNPIRKVVITSDPDNPYIVTNWRKIQEVTRAGRCINCPPRSDGLSLQLAAIHIQGDLAAGITSTHKVFIWDVKQKKITYLPLPRDSFDKETLPNRARNRLMIFDNWIVVVQNDEAVWVWTQPLSTVLTASPNTVQDSDNWKLLSSFPARSPISNLADNMTGSSSSASENARSMKLLSRSITAHGTSRSLKVLQLWMRIVKQDNCFIEAKVTEVNRRLEFTNTYSAFNVEFWYGPNQRAGILSQYDHSGRVAAIVINSIHHFYCQLVFMSSNGPLISKKLYQYIGKDDMPPCDKSGKSSLWVDDIAWSDDDFFMALALNIGCIMIFTRLGDAINVISYEQGVMTEPKIFIPQIVTEVKTKGSATASLDWRGVNLIYSDGYGLNSMELDHMYNLKELLPILLPSEPDNKEKAMHISHETNAIPSEMDSGPRRRQVHVALSLLRTSISMSSQDEIYILKSIASWLENYLPPAPHEEINYTSFQGLEESKIASNLVIKKKVQAGEVCGSLFHLKSCLEWRDPVSIHYTEWVFRTIDNVIKYLMIEGQVFYAYNVLCEAERWYNIRFYRLRLQMLVNSLVQFRNHQAYHINVLYYVHCFLLCKGAPYTQGAPLLHIADQDFLRVYLRECIEINAEDQSGVTKSPALSIAYTIQQSDILESCIRYIMGESTTFEDFGQQICNFLLKNNINEAEFFLAQDTLFLFAYYYDDTEDYFITPVEFPSLNMKRSSTIQELYHNMRQISTKKIPKSDKYSKDAAFLYWTIGNWQKLPQLLPPSIAFCALSSLCLEMNECDVYEVIEEMLRILKTTGNYELLYSAPDILHPLLITHSLIYLRENLLNFTRNETQYQNVPKSSVLVNVYQGKVPEPSKLENLLVLFKKIIGPVDMNKRRVGQIGFMKFGDVKNSSKWDKIILLNIEKLIIEVAKLFWYICVKDQFITTQHPDWGMRLLCFPEIEGAVSVMEQALNSSWVQDSEMIGVYLRESEIPRDLYQKYHRWKCVESMNRPLQIIRQAPTPNLWQKDNEFVKFMENLCDFTVPDIDINNMQKWNEMVKKYRKHYKINCRFSFSYGHFNKAPSPKESVSLDPPSESTDTIPEETRSREITRDKLSLQDPLISPGKSKPLHSILPLNIKPTIRTQYKLGVDSISKVLISLFKRTVQRIFRKRKEYMMPPAPVRKNHRRQQSNPVSAYQFMIVKSTRTDSDKKSGSSTSRPLMVNFAHLSSPRVPKHRRTSSASGMLSSSLQKPFQLILVPRNTSIAKKPPLPK